MKIKKILYFFILFFVLSGCSTTQLIKNAESLNIVFDKSAVEKCKILGEIIGSEGHWYNYFFIINSNLTQGALNNLRNKAQAMDADTVYIWEDLQFTTFVTFLGQAYNCKQ